MSSHGVIMIGYGDAAKREVERAMKSLKHIHPELPVATIGCDVGGAQRLHVEGERDTNDVWREFNLASRPDVQKASNIYHARRSKTSLYDASPFEVTCYLDADTTVYNSLEAGFRLAHDNDFVMSPSHAQERDVFWHIDIAEREATLNELEYIPVQMQCGVFWFRRAVHVSYFFRVWRDEWERYKKHDQAAFMRALFKSPMRIALLGYPWNGGAVIGHRHGMLGGRN